MTFKEQVQKLSAKEIVMSMVNGLRNPAVKVRMETYGDSLPIKSLFGLVTKEVCIGCAATNTICNLTKVKFTPKSIKNRSYTIEEHLGNGKIYEDLDGACIFLAEFETAIDFLRQGSINSYNDIASSNGFAKIKWGSKELPYLGNDDFKMFLGAYEKLADIQ
jgi:hypothetical protein|tara:strand:+ start:10254 stop:10739 length:486 start_codon:yes stop_codon:yes gene_type:complete